MENNSTSDDDPLHAKLRRKRRRRKRKSSPAQSDNDANLGDDHVGWRHHTTAATTSSSNCNALDAELENQVNKLIVQSNHDKKKRLATASYNTTICAVNTKSPNDMSSSLPMLLHIRELGLSSHLGRHRKQIPFVAKVDSLDVNGNNASWMTLLLHQPAYPGRKERIDQQRRHSGLTLDTAASNDNDHRVNSNGTRWLRAPVQNIPALHNDDNDDNYNKGSISKDASTTILYRRKSWRPYTQQTIQFSKLKTPHSVAILAMDQWGGYSIGVTGMDGSVVGRCDPSLLRPSLSLKFYGIPSPARLLSSSGQSSASPSMTSPLAHSIPLLINNQYNSSESEEAPIQISDTPMQILLCSNGAFGVGYVLDSRAAASLRSDIFSKSPALQDDLMGTVVIFETPRDGAAITKSFHCCNVRIGGWKSFTMRNALWPAMFVPVRPNANCSDVHEYSPLLFANVLSAHMLYNDEDDGFRITWIQPFKDEARDYSSRAKRIPLPSHKIQAVRNDIVTVIDEHETWEECLSDSRTGLIYQRDNDDADSLQTTSDCSPRLGIAFEVYLHIDALLIDIITRRQQSSFMFQMSPYQSDTVRFIPNFYYNLISVSGDGLDVTLVIVFSNKEKMIMQSSQPSSNNSNKKKLPAALGVVIKFSIFNQSYDELRWVQHPSCEDDSSMKQWCNSLALNWRMKECGVGVFCLEQGTLKNDTWRSATHERNVDEDVEDDFNGALWSKYNAQKEEVNMTKSRIAVAPPKDISMSSLYPHCDVITNRAVYDAIPVKKISSRKCPTELIYG